MAINIPFEFATVRMNVKELVNKRASDIEYRLKYGIYATDRDETAEQVHTRLRALQEKEEDVTMADFVNMNTLINELIERGYFQQHYAHGF